MTGYRKLLLAVSFLVASSGLCAEVAPTLTMDNHDTEPVYVRVGFATTIVLPEDEHILDYVWGDRKHFSVAGSHGANIAYIKPLFKGADTNLTLSTSSNHIYSFNLHEISKDPGTPNETKVFVKRPAATPVVAKDTCDPKLEAQLQESQNLFSQQSQSLSRAQADLANAEKLASSRVDPVQMMSGPKYHLSKKLTEEPFLVTDMRSDGKFTYIKSGEQEKAALYEEKDKKASLIEYEFKNGVYVVPKVIGDGYLRIGKKKASFKKVG